MLEPLDTYPLIGTRLPLGPSFLLVRVYFSIFWVSLEGLCVGIGYW